MLLPTIKMVLPTIKMLLPTVKMLLPTVKMVLPTIKMVLPTVDQNADQLRKILFASTTHFLKSVKIHEGLTRFLLNNVNAI